jgi:TolB-like protein/DNA-binding winged helix-turn-helix (wHTH) protein/tetratricopeptide (TPR) repeat protein
MDAVDPIGKIYRFADFRLDPLSRTFWRGDVQIVLHGRQLDALAYLLAQHDRVVPRDEMFAALWPGRRVEDNNLTQAISGLRRALGDEDGKIIVTIKTRGYRIGVPVVFEPDRPVKPPARRLAPLGAAVTVAVALAGGAWFRWQSPPAPPRSIAVLPFANLSGDPGQDYIADGLADELIDRLGQLPSLQVAGRLSAFAFKGKTAAASDIARGLHVSALVEGSLRRQGTHITVIVRLLDGADFYETWRARYDTDTDDVLRMQAEISDAVAGALQVKLAGAQAPHPAPGGTEDPVAFNAYLRGMEAFRNGGLASLHKAVAWFDEAIAKDPRFGMAYLQRGSVHEWLTELQTGEGEAATRNEQEAAERDARQALSLAPELAGAHVLAARLMAENHLDLAGAREELARGLSLGAGDARTVMDAAMLQVYTGPMAEAVAGARKAALLDPLAPETQRDLGGVLFEARQFDAASKALDDAVRLEPAETIDDRDLRAQLALAAGNDVQVIRLCGEVRDWEQRELLAIAHHAVGNGAEAERQFGLLRDELAASGAVQYAEILAQWGQHAEALHWLGAAMTARDPGLAALGVDRLLDPLRDEPQFKRLVQQLGM